MNILIAILNGSSQVILQKSPIAGLLILAGILLSSPIMSGAAILGLLIGTLTAFICRYDSKEIISGLYGFNAMLISLALSYRYELSVLLVCFIILSSGFTTILTHQFLKKLPFPPLTFPFIVVAWLITTFIEYYHLAPVEITDTVSLNTSFDAFLLSVSQIFFQTNALSAILFLTALTYSSWKCSLFTLTFTGVSILIANLLGLPAEQINFGLYGYNAALCALYVSNSCSSLSWPSLIKSTGAVLLSIWLMSLMLTFSLPAFTFPFVFSIWLILTLGKTISLLNYRVSAN